MAGNRKKHNTNEFISSDEDKKKDTGGSGYVPKQSLDPKIFLSDASQDVVPGIKDENYCMSCFAQLNLCKCAKPSPGPKAVGGSGGGGGGGGGGKPAGGGSSQPAKDSSGKAKDSKPAAPAKEQKDSKPGK